MSQAIGGVTQVQSAGPYGGLQASVGIVLPNIYTFATLPVASAYPVGTQAFVSDNGGAWYFVSTSFAWAALGTGGSGGFNPPSEASNLVLAGPASGAAATATFRSLVGADLPLPGTLAASAALTGTELAYVQQGGVLVETTTLAIANLYTGAVATEPAATVYAGPLSGANATPTFRALAGTDLPLPGGLTAAATLTGSEIVYVEQGGVLVQTTVAKIVASASSTGATLITAVTTSSALIASYPPGSNANTFCQTTDMGLMFSDGIRWTVVSGRKPPPGAFMHGCTKNLFTCFPNINDIGNLPAGTNNTPGAYSLYNGYPPYGTNSEGAQSSYGTDAQGRLTMAYLGAGLANCHATMTPYATGKAYVQYGRLPMWQANQPFYAEFAAVMQEVTATTDCWNAGFIMAQENNNAQDDSNTAINTKWEQWHEFDVCESGQGTNRSGDYRGAYLQHMGWYNWANTFQSAPSGTITTFPLLTNNWGGETATFPITLGGTGQVVNGNFTAGSKTVTCASTTITTGATASFTTGYVTPVNNSIVNTTSIDITLEHTYGCTYDPASGTYSIFIDGVLSGTVSTTNVNSSNTFRDALRYRWLFFCQSWTSPYTASKMGIRYFDCWVP